MRPAPRSRAARPAPDFRAARGERDDPLAVGLGAIGGPTMYGWILGRGAVIRPDRAQRTWARAELQWWMPRAPGAAFGRSL
jgi:hypothetical protein